MTTCPAHNLAAIETGALVTEYKGTGRVVSTYGKAVNIRMPNGLLISLVKDPTAMTAMSVCCPDYFSSKAAASIRIDTTVKIDSDGLVLGHLKIDTASAHIFDGRPEFEKNIGNSADSPLSNSTLDLFDRILHFAGQKDGLLGLTRPETNAHAALRPNLLLKKARIPARRILMQPKANIANALTDLIGLGPGFTPAGDDLICGFLMGEKLFPSRYIQLTAKGRQHLLNAAKATSDGGRTLISLALKGRFPKFLLNAATRLKQAKTTKDMLRLVLSASGHGHTSGTDALTGLLLFLKAAGRRQLALTPDRYISFSG